MTTLDHQPPFFDRSNNLLRAVGLGQALLVGSAATYALVVSGLAVYDTDSQIAVANRSNVILWPSTKLTPLQEQLAAERQQHINEAANAFGGLIATGLLAGGVYILTATGATPKRPDS